jgi:hypothetical protein
MKPKPGEKREKPAVETEKTKEEKDKEVDEAGEESFPASDAPSYSPGPSKEKGA